MKLIKVKYNQGKNEGYFIKHRRGYIPILIEQRTFCELKNIISECEVDIDYNGNIK